MLTSEEIYEVLKNEYIVYENGTIYRKDGKEVRQYYTAKKYKNCSLKVNGKPKTFLVHRLIAIWFIRNEDNKVEVNHINGLKDDNNVKNLEWATASENRIHAYKNGLHNSKGQRNSFSKLRDIDVIEIKKTYKLNPKTPLSYFSNKFNVTVQLISMIKKNKAWCHL